MNRRAPTQRSTASSTRLARVRLLVDREHYDTLVQQVVSRAEVSVWIGTANIKDLRIEAPLGTVARAAGRYLSIVERFADLTRAGVEVRILHSGIPSRAFRAALATAAGRLTSPRFELRQCPRVHLKMIAVDGKFLYLGSANLTGAGLGAKGEGRRNFELGIVTDDDVLLDTTQARFDAIWRGKECGGCRLRTVCPKPLDGGARGQTRGTGRRATPKTTGPSRAVPGPGPIAKKRAVKLKPKPKAKRAIRA